MSGSRSFTISPAAAVGVELLRAVGDVLLLPPRIVAYLLERDRLCAELREDLQQVPSFEEGPATHRTGERGPRIFLSCAEPSGELHAISLARALREEVAAVGGVEPELTGLGGAALAEEGVRCIGDPVARARMGFDGIHRALPWYLRLLTRVARTFRDSPPDLFVPVDSPALHVPIAHLARRYGVPTAHFVTPQYWGWAPWRVAGYRRCVQRALTILPFEEAWFERRGVRTRHVGHPLLDRLDGVARGDGEAASNVLALLPGSREGVIGRNLPWMLQVALDAKRRQPAMEIEVLQGSRQHEELVRGIVDGIGAGEGVRVVVGDIHERLVHARSAFSVSGTVLLDLLHHRLPMVIVYRLASRRMEWMQRNLLTAPWFASVNLLAGEEVCPEFCFRGEGPREAVREALLRAHSDEAWREGCGRGLERAAERLGPAGAARRAARACLELIPESKGAPRTIAGGAG